MQRWRGRNVFSYKYCYIAGGTLNNAQGISNFLVLSNTMDITFEDAAYRLFGSDTSKMKDIYALPIVD